MAVRDYSSECDCPKKTKPSIRVHYDLCASTPIYASMCAVKSPGMISNEITTARLGRTPDGRQVTKGPYGRWVTNRG